MAVVHTFQFTGKGFNIPDSVWEQIGIKEGDVIIITVSNDKIEISKQDQDWEKYLAFEEKYEGVFRRLA